MSATHRTKDERRNSLDEYYTPPGLAREGVKRLIRDGWIRDRERTKVLEPSCGNMAWVKALLGNGFSRDKLLANDVNLSGKWTTNLEFSDLDLRARDFLNASYKGFDLVIGNPPYNDIMAHIEEAFAAMTSTGILAYLLSTTWFTANGEDGSRRRWIQNEGKPTFMYLCTPRPKFRETGGTDSAAYGLFIWAPGVRAASGFDILDWYDEREIDYAEAKAAKAIAKAV
jgi:hypothetical protein